MGFRLRLSTGSSGLFDDQLSTPTIALGEKKKRQN
jgi:hypothetical protein